MKISNSLSLFFYSSFFERSNAKHCISILFLLFLLGGCSHNYTPDASTFKFDPITEFSSKKSITLANIQSNSGEQLFAEGSGHTFYANYQAWTDTTIEIAGRELIAREMNVVSDAQKTLKLSIETVKGTTGMYVQHCFVSLKVETSEGYVKTYFGDNRSPAGMDRAADGAVMRAVAAMLQDEKIISYLKK